MKEMNGTKTLDSGKLMYSDGNNDECYTPNYGVTPILEYIPKNAVVWCPFDTEMLLYPIHHSQTSVSSLKEHWHLTNHLL